MTRVRRCRPGAVPLPLGTWGAVLLAVALGCRSATPSPYAPLSEATRSTARAEALNREAADLMETEAAKAERLLREALTADLFHGPAHNNLGVLFLEQGKLYEAAGEFEWAKKLMPGHPDPRVNLALTLERAGRIDEAFAGYESALEVWPDYLPAIQGLASLTVRTGRQDARLARWLDAIAMRAESVHWREWARARSQRTR